MYFAQITMSKKEGVKTIVVGGKSDVPQQYCGVVGGQSTDFSTIDVEIKVRFRPYCGRHIHVEHVLDNSSQE
jgi:hypothetical protein